MGGEVQPLNLLDDEAPLQLLVAITITFPAVFPTFDGETSSDSFSATKRDELLLVVDNTYVSTTIHYTSADATVDCDYTDASENILWEWLHAALVPHIWRISVRMVTTSIAP